MKCLLKNSREYLNAQRKEWRHKKGISKEYRNPYSKNPEEQKEKARINQNLWHEKNREKMNEYNKKYRSKFNMGHRTNYNREWFKRNPLRRKEYNHKGNYKHKLATKDLTYETIQTAYERIVLHWYYFCCLSLRDDRVSIFK